MIPLLLLVGLLAGRWYVAAVATIAWPVVLVVSGVTSDPASLAAGAALAAANTGLGVAVHKAVVWGVRAAATASGVRGAGRPSE